MTREEILQIAKPILFNTDMVRAILDDRKTVTRRPIKCKYSNTHLEMFTNKYGTRLIEIQDDVEGETFGKNPDGTTWRRLRGFIETEYERKPYRKGQYLYVRETWSEWTDGYVYRAWTSPFPQPGRYADEFMTWRPSIHMPKEAARIFLRVTDVRVKHLHDIDGYGILAEGVDNGKSNPAMGKRWENMQRMAFSEVWNSTIPKKDLDKYDWDANPWVWVIEFERIHPDDV